MSSSYRIELDRWLMNLHVEADRCLDIGGSQLPVKGRTLTWDVKEYLIADLPEPHVGSPKPDIELDMNKYDDIQASTFQMFDTVFCLEVFDYIYDPRIALSKIWSFLSTGGTAWVTFPAFYPHHQPIEDDALLYKEYGIRKLAEATGLKIVQMIKRRPETNALEQFFSAERMRAAKNYDHHVTGWIVEFTK
jgi:2-polyprenyl-3-methyl-5-hydroxy-6-metoxy-1,4-benzoquinol methylase